eukprot:TRINITY_DN19668_c0_g1_i2.p1 TRINITY_DN19668_c0_g1~~TRINITY_DN19668_c0_g1_i2.p1  ORF type:complete len:679 (+),score=164.62 TRINITY_DN19668_c0_g1_i2:136-2172(+)
MFQKEGATGWLRTYLEASDVRTVSTPAELRPAAAKAEGAAERKSDFLTNIFQNVRVKTLFLPATSKEQLQDLSRLSWDQLTPEFREEVSDLKSHVLRSLEARQFAGRQMNGHSLASAIQFVVQGLQQGMFHELPSLWKSWQSQVADVSLQDAEKWFATLSEHFDGQASQPVPLAVFSERVEDAQERAMAFYKKLLRGFDLTPRTAELRKRTEAQLQAVVGLYHERIRAWVGESTADIKARYAKELAAKLLPVDPATLEKDGDASLKKAGEGFAAEMRRFVSAGTSAKGRGRVSMPAFPQEPSVQLGVDLKAQLAMRVLENERRVQHMFKEAMNAADAAVGRALNATSSRLLTKAQLQELSKNAEDLCWQVFDKQLSGHSWMKKSAQYRLHKALLQNEHLHGRLGRFVAAHEERLQGHFRTGLQSVLATYNLNRSTISMPAPEEDVDAEHGQMAAATRGAFIVYAANLSDTAAFTEAHTRLDDAMNEGLQQVREKNVEFWKVHSDEATRCAVALNKKVNEECSWFCLFRIFPFTHRRTSRHHLMQCFSKDGTAYKMSPALQSHVFDVWYRKDLGHDAERVENRFSFLLYLSAFLMTGLLLFIWCGAGCLEPPLYQQPHAQQVYYGNYNGYSQAAPCYVQAPPSYSPQWSVPYDSSGYYGQAAAPSSLRRRLSMFYQGGA